MFSLLFSSFSCSRYRLFSHSFLSSHISNSLLATEETMRFPMISGLVFADPVKTVSPYLPPSPPLRWATSCPLPARLTWHQSAPRPGLPSHYHCLTRFLGFACSFSGSQLRFGLSHSNCWLRVVTPAAAAGWPSPQRQLSATVVFSQFC